MTEPAKNRDLHGNVPDRCAVAVILVDVINDFEFEGATRLFRQALKTVRPIAALKKRARALGVPVIYVNDNFGKWRSDFRRLLAHTLRRGVRGRRIAAALKPDVRDYFVLKPTYSAFHSTTLDLLLDYLGTRTVILAGFAGNACVLFSANDAFLRDLELFVPRDCTASESFAANRAALKHISSVLKGDTRPAARIELEALRAQQAD
jgi:nicotinamidase-related amidase